MEDYASLPTEAARARGPELDLLAPAEIARLLLAEEAEAHAAVARVIGPIGRACEAAAAALRDGGRLFYAGAGTSGRLGVLDAAEAGPTFGAAAGVVVALLAGAPRAMTGSVEGAEDDFEAGRAAMRAQAPASRDCAVGITMSGTAAFVAGAMEEGGRGGACRVLLTANPSSAIRADLVVALDLGPELLAGSTRLKGGSATKAVLNMLSTAALATTGAVYGDRMVAVRPVNRKLRDRAERLVMELAALDRDHAARLLVDAGDDVRVAVLMARRRCARAEALERLRRAGGSLRRALA